MEIIVVSLAALLVALLTFFSGFGLSTILTPVFVIFFPVDLSIALTGVVHFFNNIFKLILVGKKADRQVLIQFGIPAVIASIIGAWVLLQITDLQPLFSYTISDRKFEVLPVKFIIAILLVIFTVIDLLPNFGKLFLGKERLPVGGFLSGFFGGLSGHQGALRSAFLIRSGLSKESFIATAAVIAAFVDFTRLSVYASRFAITGLQDKLPLIVAATLSGITGSFIGSRLLKKISLRLINIYVAIMLIIIAILLGAGLI
jgi:uncharacterized protein